MPNLSHLDVTAAGKALEKAGLKLGDVVYEFSDSVSVGLIMAQDPAALSKANAGTAVKVTVSRGKQAPETTTVPNLIGLSQTDAEKAIAQAKLVAVQDDPIVTSEVAPGLVCKQSIAAGTNVTAGTRVSIATSLADTNVEVPDLVGLTYDGASEGLSTIGLGCDKVEVYSETVDKGVVIAQSIESGTSVQKGTIVTLTVSLGKAPTSKVSVPDVYTYKLSEAKATLESCGLDVRYVGDENGTVVAMDPDCGTEVDLGTTVTLVLQASSQTVAVPNIVGLKGKQANDACKEANLGLSYDTSKGDHPIQLQSPTAGTIVDVGSVVYGFYESGPASGMVWVPDVSGMSGPEALAVLLAVHLGFDYDETDPFKYVSSTTPAAGETVPEYTTIVAQYDE